MQQNTGTDVTEADTMVEQLREERLKISENNMKDLLHFVVLSATTNEYLFFIKEKLVRIKEIEHGIAELKAPNRKTRKVLEKRHQFEMRKFKRSVKDASALLQKFSDTWTKDPKYAPFVEDSIDLIGKTLDSIQHK